MLWVMVIPIILTILTSLETEKLDFTAKEHRVIRLDSSYKNLGSSHINKRGKTRI